MKDEFGPGDLDIWHNPFVERVRRSRLRWWQWTIVALVGLAIVGGAAGFFLLNRLQSIITDPRIPTEAIPDSRELEPFNVLLVGSDSREGLTEEEKFLYGADDVPGERADTLILGHIDPEENTVIMVQFPRDLYVPVAGRGSAKINSALEDGPRNLMETVENLTGLDIHHYAQVNIAGFRDVVDAIGGVDVCITESIPFDPATGIEVTEDELGMVHFDGERALRFVRSRRFPNGDFGRIQNQQMFVSAALDKVTSVSTFLSPARLVALYRAAGDNLTVDRNTQLTDLKDILDRLGSIDPVTHEAYIVPNLGISRNEAGSVVLPDPEAMQLLFDSIERNRSPQEADGVPDVDPSTIHVRVLGAGHEGGAADAAAQIQAATSVGGRSVTILAAEEGDEPRRSTVIRYAPGALASARLVAAAIPRSVLEEDELGPGVDLEVYAGRVFSTERITQIRALELPAPSDPPARCR